MPAYFKIIGDKNSGKTTFICRLLKYFKERDFKVSAVKHTSHNHDFDVPDTDSWKFQKAGALNAIISSPDKWVCHSNKIDIGFHRDIEDKLFENIDIVLIEGKSDIVCPILQILNSGRPVDEKLDQNTIAIVSDVQVKSKIPVFNRDNVESAANLIIGLIS